MTRCFVYYFNCPSRSIGIWKLYNITILSNQSLNNMLSIFIRITKQRTTYVIISIFWNILSYIFNIKYQVYFYLSSEKKLLFVFINLCTFAENVHFLWVIAPPNKVPKLLTYVVVCLLGQTWRKTALSVNIFISK